MDIQTLLLFFCFFFVAGIVKGIIGIGFPAILIAGLTLFMPPRDAIALILLALLATNLRQALRGESVWAVAARYWRFNLPASIGIFWVALFGALMPAAMLLFCAGAVMVIYGLQGLFYRPIQWPARFDHTIQYVMGTFAAIFGGLSAIWGPPVAIYFAGKGLGKDALVQAVGVVFGLQGMFLLIGFLVAGDLSVLDIQVGALMALPSLIAVFLGEQLRKHLNLAQFMRVFMIMFILLGINLMRRGLLG